MDLRERQHRVSSISTMIDEPETMMIADAEQLTARHQQHHRQFRQIHG